MGTADRMDRAQDERRSGRDLLSTFCATRTPCWSLAQPCCPLARPDRHALCCVRRVGDEGSERAKGEGAGPLLPEVDLALAVFFDQTVDVLEQPLAPLQEIVEALIFVVEVGVWREEQRERGLRLKPTNGVDHRA